MEWARRNVPEPFPGNFHAAFAGKLFARVLRFPQHFREGGWIEVTLVQGNAAFFNDAGDNPGFGGAGTDGANAVAAACGNAVNLGTHLRGREKGIAPAVHWRAAGMRGL